MDPTRLDALARSLTAPHSRRVLTRLLSGLAFAAPLSLLGGPDAAAKKKGRKKHKKGKKRDVCATGTEQCPTALVPTAPLQSRCTGDPDCLAYRCDISRGTCLQGCEGNRDCQPGWWCGDETGRCDPCGAGAPCPCTSDAFCLAYRCDLSRGTCLQGCEGNGDCQPGYRCDEGTCVRCVAGDTCPCIADEDCAAYICDSVAGECYDSCEDHEECQPNFLCDAVGNCVPAGSCVVDENCGSRLGVWCNAGVCAHGCNSHTHCDDCHLCDLATHQCCFFAGNICNVARTCPN